MPGDIAHEQLCERIVRARVVGQMFLGENEALLPADPIRARDHRALADDAIETQRVEQVDAALVLRIDAEALEKLERLGARAPAVAQGRSQRAHGSCDHLVVDTEISLPAGRLTPLPVGSDVQNPTEVCGANDMESASHGPRAHQHTSIEFGIDFTEGHEAARAGSERPPPGREVLALHGEHPLRGISHGRRRCAESMRAHSLCQQGRGVHSLILPVAADDRYTRCGPHDAAPPPRS